MTTVGVRAEARRSATLTVLSADFAKRAEERRMRLTGGVARSFEELDLASRAYWDAASYEVKLQATHDAIADAWIVKGQHGPPPRFDGCTWGVLKFER